MFILFIYFLSSFFFIEPKISEGTTTRAISITIPTKPKLSVYYWQCKELQTYENKAKSESLIENQNKYSYLIRIFFRFETGLFQSVPFRRAFLEFSHASAKPPPTVAPS